MARRKIHEASHTSFGGMVHTAKAYRDSDAEEWQVDFFVNGVKLKNSRYHTGDKEDAIGTVNWHIDRVAKQMP